MLLSTPFLTILSEEQKFNGENLPSWTTNMTQLLGSKGLSGYVDSRITLPPQLGTGAPIPDPTPIYSVTLSVNEWHFQDQLVRGHITLDIGKLHCTVQMFYQTGTVYLSYTVR